MNDKIVEAVRAKMKDDGITQEALANRLGMARTNLVRLVNGHVGSVPKRWQDVLNELGLELIAVPKTADVREPGEKTPVETVSKATETRSDVSQKGTKDPVKRAAPVELPPEVEELRRRWRAGEFKTKDVHAPTGGMWLVGTAHKELGYLFQELKHKHKTRRKAALDWLIEVAAANPREEA